MKFITLIIFGLSCSFAIAQSKKSTHPTLGPNEVAACKVKCLTDPSQDFVLIGNANTGELSEYCGLKEFEFYSFSQFAPPASPENPKPDTASDPGAYFSYRIRPGNRYEYSNFEHKHKNLRIIYNQSAGMKYSVEIQSIGKNAVFECRIQTSPMMKWDIDKIYPTTTQKSINESSVKIINGADSTKISIPAGSKTLR